MRIIFPLFIPTALYFIVLVVLLVKKTPKGIGTSLIFFGLAMAAGFWAIVQSRSSTAGLGFLVLPFLSTLAGFLGLAFGRWATGAVEPGPPRTVGRLALAAAVVLVGFTVFQGFKTRARYSARSESQRAFSAEIYRNRELIARDLANNPGREREYLDSSIRVRMNDRAFVLAALQSESISPAILDTLANSADRGIAVEAVRNPATRTETLARVYGRELCRDYCFQALAGHANTPPDILRKLYVNPGVISGLDIWFAGNPATPRDVLAQIAAKTTDAHVLDRLVQNPALDCAMLRQIQGALTRLNRPEDDYSVTRVADRMRESC